MSDNVVTFPTGRGPVNINQHGYLEWVQQGIDAGYCTEVKCLVHASYDLLTDEEAEQVFDEGEPDHCVFGVRLHET